MNNKIERQRVEQKYPIMIHLTKKEHDMLKAFAEIEKRAKSNAAQLLLSNALKAMFSNSYSTNFDNN